MSYLIETMNAPILNCSRAARIGPPAHCDRVGNEGSQRSCRLGPHDGAWCCVRVGADAIRLILQRQQRPARQQFAICHFLSGGGNDHCRNHLRCCRNYYLWSARVALDVEIHYRSSMFRLWWHMRGGLRL